MITSKFAYRYYDYHINDRPARLDGKQAQVKIAYYISGYIIKSNSISIHSDNTSYIGEFNYVYFKYIAMDII